MAATKAQCAYCFESLCASFEKRKPLILDEVEQLWDEYHQKQRSTTGQTSENEATARLASRPAAVAWLMDSDNSSASSSAPSASSSTPSLNNTSSSATSTSSGAKSSLLSVARRLSRGSRSTNKQEEEYPLFVTYERTKHGIKELRGCIGTFEPHKLDKGLHSYALTSAFEDIRFTPITPRELTNLDCSITLLTDFETVSDPLDWEIGKHGIRISFVHKGRKYGSTYLPNVAPEQGWNKEETMYSLMRKAGWSGSSDEWKKVPVMTVVRYQGSKSALSYREFREWRDWVDETRSKS